MQPSNIVIPVILILVAVVFLVWRSKKYDYQCDKCGNKFSLSVWQVALSPKAMGRKLVKCPKCRGMVWVNPVPK